MGQYAPLGPTCSPHLQVLLFFLFAYSRMFTEGCGQLSPDTSVTETGRKEEEVSEDTRMNTSSVLMSLADVHQQYMSS